MTITLKEITEDNWEEASQLSVEAEQENYVASNVYSLAQSQFHRSWVPLGIYDEQTMVGFLMYGQDDTPGEYWIIRLMIDKKYQGRGYGRIAMQEIIEHLAHHPETRAILTSYVPGNQVAAKLYAGLGFEKTGQIEDGEEVVRLQIRT
jgi:diamine N-acetyltransferase